MYTFSARSNRNLVGVAPDLLRVVHRALAISEVDFAVVEGLRSRARQVELVKQGASKTMNSRHLTGHAVDLAPVIAKQIRWDWPPFYVIAKAMKQASQELNIPVEWGGDWRKFKDGPHWQLPHKEYPA